MFSTLYGQSEAANQLKKALSAKRLPGALLFSGPRFSGRLTAALETARIRACQESGAPLCTCRSCRSSYAGSHPYTLLLLSRNMEMEIEAAHKLFQRIPTSANRLYLTRQIRKVTGSFQSDLFDEHSPQVRSQIKAAFEIDEQLTELETLTSDKKAAAAAKKCVQSAQKLIATAKSGNIAVARIRKIATWLYTTPEHEPKCVIIEGIEHISTASQNALLKILEEPPAGTLFIIVSELPGRIPLTILSRVRRYHFQERSWEDQARVISEQYQDDSDNYDSLKTFFLVQSGIDCRRLREDAEQFAASMQQRADLPCSSLQAMLVRISEEKLFTVFIEEVLSVLEEEVEARLISPVKAAELSRSLHDAYMRCTLYNMHPAAVLESLHNSIRYGTV